ncbi:uncharacterized protein METZ01_LOCUS219344, partial [marine metagenome]
SSVGANKTSDDLSPLVVGWKQAVKERDEGTFDWTSNSPFDDSGRENKD